MDCFSYYQALVQIANRHTVRKTELQINRNKDRKLTERQRDRQIKTDKCSLMKTHNVMQKIEKNKYELSKIICGIQNITEKKVDFYLIFFKKKVSLLIFHLSVKCILWEWRECSEVQNILDKCTIFSVLSDSHQIFHLFVKCAE